MTALIDGDYLLYIVPHKMKGLSDSLSDFTKEIDNNFQWICDQCQTDHFLLFLTEGSFRHRIARSKQYKGNRVSRKPMFFHDLKLYLYDTYFAISVEDLEADDLVIMYHKRLKDEGTPNVIVSPDKDLYQVPGQFYNPQKDHHKMIEKKEAAWNFWYSMLCGDSSDNIPGVKGVGDKTARKILDQEDDATSVASYRRAVHDTYISKMGMKEGVNAFAENFNLLFILRSSNQYQCEVEPMPVTTDTEEEVEL